LCEQQQQRQLVIGSHYNKFTAKSMASAAAPRHSERAHTRVVFARARR
jgi:hypothetical protein